MKMLFQRRKESTMSTTTTVLIGTPLGEESDTMVATAFEVARKLGAARVHLAHAFELPPLSPGPYFTAPPATLDFEELGKALDESLEEQIERLHLRERGPISRHIVSGPAHRVLIDLARDVTADLVVLGAHRGRFPHLVGSTAARVVRKAPCPVLMLRGPLPLPPHRVLLPVDLSPISAEVIARGLELLALMSAGPNGGPGHCQVAVEAFHVVVPYEFEVFAPRYDPAEAKREAMIDLAEFLGARSLGQGWTVTCAAGFGGATVEIARRTEEWHPDLVIVGSHGYSGFERFLIGSVAEGVVSGSAANVLVIPPLALQREREAVSPQVVADASVRRSDSVPAGDGSAVACTH
jgi:nucleotide-binding universal stress UspA family protein